MPVTHPDIFAPGLVHTPVTPFTRERAIDYDRYGKLIEFHIGNGADTLALSRNVTGSLLNVYAMRMAAVFTLTTVNIARRTAIVSRWLILAGLACALILLVGTGISPWVELLFPAWILALSLDVLIAAPPPSEARP